MAKAVAKAKKDASNSSPELEVTKLVQNTVTICLLGVTPFYCNRVADKARRELLMPRGRMTQAQRSQSLKHDPRSEYRSSPYKAAGDKTATRILMKATAIKGAIANAAIDMPTSVAKAQINRLTYVVDEWIPIWGVPVLDMDIVRSAGMDRTPDIRTRAKIVNWATVVRIRYTLPMVTDRTVSHLIQAAGMIIGIGDFRQQLGKGSNGLFELVNDDDPRFLEVLKHGGREAQDEALEFPLCSNPESEELLAWFDDELERRNNASPVTASDAAAEVEDEEAIELTEAAN